MADMATIQEAYTAYLVKNGGAQKVTGLPTSEIYDDILPMLVEQGYLDFIPVPPTGNAIFVNADENYREMSVLTGASYTFINHADVSTADVLVAIYLGWGDPQPLNRFTNKY